jgi:hypothetical protein
MNALSIDVEQLADLSQALFKLAAAAKANAQFVRLADKTIREEFELFDWLERRSIEPTFDFEYHHIKVQFTGDGPLLADFWRLLRQAGYNTDSRPKKGDTSYYGWWNKLQSATIALNFSSSVCKRVQTGTRTVTREEPIYETVCGESLEIAADEPTLVEHKPDDDIPF